MRHMRGLASGLTCHTPGKPSLCAQMCASRHSGAPDGRELQWIQRCAERLAPAVGAGERVGKTSNP